MKKYIAKSKDGKNFSAPYPFVKCVNGNVHRWRPGVVKRSTSCKEFLFATDEGEILLTVIQRCKMPGRYQDRVFYKRQWKDPDGKVFGSGELLVHTKGWFNKISKGYIHSYEIDSKLFEEENNSFSLFDEDWR